LTRLWPILAFSLLLPLVIALAVIHAQPSDAQAIRDFLGGSVACQPPCFMGIRAGETRFEDTAALLMSSGWVRKIYQSEAPAALAWDWNGQQPKWIDATSPGHLATDNELIVSYIDIQTNIPASVLWLAYGPPPRGFITTRPRLVTHFIGYPQVGVDAYVQIACPATTRQFWNAHAYVYWGVAWRPGTADNDYPRLWRQHIAC
jgi:hypothetical protein